MGRTIILSVFVFLRSDVEGRHLMYCFSAETPAREVFRAEVGGSRLRFAFETLEPEGMER